MPLFLFIFVLDAGPGAE